MSQVSRRLEVGNHKRCTLNTRLSSGTSAGTFVESVGPYMNYSDEAGKKGSENRSSRFEPKILWISFSRGSGPPLRLGWVSLERTRILGRFQFTRYFIEFVLVETNQLVGSNPNVILTQQHSKHAAVARGGLREANTERWHSSFVFPCEFAVCFWFQNVEKSPIPVCAQLRDLQRQCRCAVATSDKFCGQTRF